MNHLVFPIKCAALAQRELHHLHRPCARFALVTQRCNLALHQHVSTCV